MSIMKTEINKCHCSYFMYCTEFLFFELSHCSLHVLPCTKCLYEALAKQEQKSSKKERNVKKNIYFSNKAIDCQIMFLNFQELSALNNISVVFTSLVIE